MTDEQFKAIRGFLLTIVILLGLISGNLLTLAWQYSMVQSIHLKRPSKSRDWLEAECLKIARCVPGGSRIERVTIRRLRSKVDRPNWKVADILPQPDLALTQEIRTNLVRIAGKYALE